MTAIAIMAAISFTSCDDGDDYWWGPNDNNQYYDSNLIGTWQLVEANGQAVTPSDTNYLEFLTGGRGYYFYYTGGIQATQRTLWVCNAGYYRDSVTIRYQDGRQSTMNYWFTDGANYLYLQWRTANGNQYTYVYRYLGNQVPW